MSQTKNIQLQQNSDELISQEIKEIISYRPHWIIRKGNILFFLVIASLLGISWFISYPDVIGGHARLVSLNAPKMIAAKKEGKLLKLLVSDGEKVKKNTHLGLIESIASYNEVMLLQGWVEQTIRETTGNNYDSIVQNPLPSLINLGELQSFYQDFQNEYIETGQLLTKGYYQNRKAVLQQDLNFISDLKANVSQQKTLVEQDHELQKKEYEAYEILEKEKVIAPLELNNYKSKLIAKQQSLKQINAQMSNNDLVSHGKLKEIMDLDKMVLDQRQKFHSSLLNLKTEIETWIRNYVLMAPEDGAVMFVFSVRENELVAPGQDLFYIQPGQSQYYAELMVAQKGLGKLDTGQKVILKAEGYPSEEYGNLTGIVSYIAGMPNRRDSFLVKVKLPQGLKTNYREEILFRNNLSAQAQIITDNRKLWDRLFGQLKRLGGR